MFRYGIAAALAAAAFGTAVESQVPPAAALTYADLADLALGAPVAAHVRIDDATRLDADEAPGLRPGKTRFYVEADVVSLIKGARGLPARVRYLADIANEPNGRAPRLRDESEFILLAATVPGRPGELQLVGPGAHLPYTPALADRLRAILREAVQPDAPPEIVGIGRAFHVPGSLPGESETQIFLLAEDQRPVSLTVLRRPGQAPAWAVSLNEIVDNAAAPPVPGTLLWYRLACSLPRALPAQSTAEAGPSEAAAIEADYRLVLDRLGPCARNRKDS